MGRKEHWEDAWSARSAEQLSWYQDEPTQSLQLIARAAGDSRPSVIDIGGGASRLVDGLLAHGFADVSVLDISATALQAAQRRLGPRAAAVTWICADVTGFRPARRYGIWHDRAAFHFLVEPSDRCAYVAALGAALEPGGQAIIATFALDGPPRCSGLDVVRYDATTLAAELGSGYRLEEESAETHTTPAGKPQRFAWFRFRRDS
jgi:SAM-dependent methyltransferase